jgi:O-antigen ligase
VTIIETDPASGVETVASDNAEVGRSVFVRWGVTTHDVLVLTAAAMFCAGVGPFEFGGWTLRMAALLAGLPIGVVILVRLARQRDKASLVALAFLVWAVVGALASGAPWRSILGQVDGNTQSVVIFLGVFGFWALARTMSERGRSLAGPVLVAALGVSALIGILQIVLNIEGGSLAHVGGRAGGLEGNAALYSATLCGAFAWCASISESAAGARARLYGLAGVLFFAVGIGLSGTRVSIIAVGLVCIAVVVHARTLRSLRVTALAVLGFVTSNLMQHLFLPTAVTKGATAVDRFSSVGTEGRIELWKAGMSAFRANPLLGSGVGRVRPAIQHHFTPEFVRVYQRDDFSMAWNDVHNVFVQMLVSVGIVGFVLLAAFVVLSVRKGDFGLALAAAAISVNWMLQPTGLSSLAIAMIFLGAAAVRNPELCRSVRTRRLGSDKVGSAVTVGAVVIGFAAALALVGADLNLRHAVQTGDSAQIRAAAGWFGDDPFVTDVFFVDTYKASDPHEAQARVEAARRAVAAEPDVPVWWNELAMTQWDTRDFEGMRQSVEKALELQPNHVRSWVQLTAYAKHVGDVELEATARKHACDLGAPVCQPG